MAAGAVARLMGGGRLRKRREIDLRDPSVAAGPVELAGEHPVRVAEKLKPPAQVAVWAAMKERPIRVYKSGAPVADVLELGIMPHASGGHPEGTAWMVARWDDPADATSGDLTLGGAKLRLLP